MTRTSVFKALGSEVTGATATDDGAWDSEMIDSTLDGTAALGSSLIAAVLDTSEVCDKTDD